MKYTRERVTELWAGQDSLTLPEIADLDIPFSHRMWVLIKLMDDERQRLLACDVAQRVLPVFEKAWPDDSRPRACIEVARQFVDGNATHKEMAAADAAADAAAWDAAWVWQLQRAIEILEGGNA